MVERVAFYDAGYHDDQEDEFEYVKLPKACLVCGDAALCGARYCITHWPRRSTCNCGSEACTNRPPKPPALPAPDLYWKPPAMRLVQHWPEEATIPPVPLHIVTDLEAIA